MSLASHLAQPEADAGSASAVLGSEHPLTRALDDLSIAVRQVEVTVVLALATALDAAAGASWGRPALLGVAAGAVGLVARVLLLRMRRDTCVIDLLMRADSRVELAAVRRMRRRLMDPNRRRQLAKALSSARATVTTSASARLVAFPLANPRVIAAVDGELTDVIALLACSTASVCGVAWVWRLLEGPATPLYGDDPRALREQLTQIRYALSSASSSNNDDQTS
jgi:hypothetical protein